MPMDDMHFVPVDFQLSEYYGQKVLAVTGVDYFSIIVLIIS